MSIADRGKSANADELVRQIGALDLAENVVELAAYGFTIIPPEKTGLTPELVGELRDGLIACHERRAGMRIGDYRTYDGPNPLATCGDIWWLLEEPGIVESLVNPAVLAMARWLVGNSATLSGSAYLLKSMAQRNDWTEYAPLHTDTHGMPGPTSPIAQACNTSLLLTDYDDLDDGPTVLLPGSHLFGRPPQGREAQFWADIAPYPADRMVPIQGKAGSLAVWHGNAWHGALPRRKPGLRITLVHYWVRSYLRPMNDYRGHVPAQLLERYPQLDRILGLSHCYPWKHSMDPDRSLVDFMARGCDPFA